MGLFDTLTIDPSLLPLAIDEGRSVVLPSADWQTKDLDEGMLHYRVRADGTLEIERLRSVEPPPGGWPDCEGRATMFRSWPRCVHECWEDASVTACLELRQFWTDKDHRHSTIAQARRDISVTLRAEFFRGRLQGPITLVNLEGKWWEPLGDGWAPVGEDPAERVARIEGQRIAALQHRLRQSRRSPEERLLRILARSLPSAAYRQVRTTLLTELKNPSGRYMPKRRRNRPGFTNPRNAPGN